MDDDLLLWPAPPADVSLDSDSVHVWAIPLHVSDEMLEHLAGTLALVEKKRADAFHFDRDRNRFIVGRGMLRTILGRYLHAQPGVIWFEYGAHGKPLLAGRFARSGLQFNLAHCEDLALLAVARGRVVGIDLERVRAMESAHEMAACFCSPRESAEFQSLSPDQKDEAFFRLWTRKEAWLKASGKGIGQSLEEVEVSFRAGETEHFLHLPKEAGTIATGWHLQELIPTPGFIGALTFPGEWARLSCWKCEEKEQFEYAY
jgi:4'-phosphopantetheinyl transferase